MTSMWGKKSLSTDLLVRALRYKTNNDIVKTIAVVATTYNPSHEINIESYDSPWRSLGLIFSFAKKNDIACSAFDKGIKWFEAMLDEDSKKPTVLRGARLTMQSLCLLQAGRIERLPNELFHEVMECLDKANYYGDPQTMERHLYIDYTRLSFLSEFYGLEKSKIFVEKASTHYKPSRTVHPSIQFLVEELDSLWLRARLANEVGDANALCETFSRLLSFHEAFQKASLEGAWEIGSDLGVRSVLKGYLGAVDFCAPTLSEANQAVLAVVDFLNYQKLQPNQSICDRATLLLARSIFSPVVSLKDMPNIATFLQESISTCIEATKRLDVSVDLIYNKLSIAFTDFVATDFRRFCNDATSSNERIEVFQRICSAAKESKIPLKYNAYKDISELLLEDQEMLYPVKLNEIAAATEQFGSILRERLDIFPEDDKFPIKSYLKQAAFSHCNKFLESVIEDNFSSHNQLNQISSIKEAIKVYAYAGLDPGAHLWNTAFDCLQRIPSEKVMPVLTLWILEDPNLKVKLYLKLDTVFELIAKHAQSNVAMLPIGISALMNHNRKAVLDFLFGNDPTLQEIMLPVLCCVINSNEQPIARDVLFTWVTAKNRLHFNYEQFTRETVAFLLKISPEKSAEIIVYNQAAHQLIARKITTKRNQPELAPLVAKLLDIQMLDINRTNIEQQLLSKNDSKEAISINFIEYFRKLSDQEALELLEYYSNHSNLLVGNNHDLQEIISSVLYCVINAKEQSMAKEILFNWVVAENEYRLNYEQFTRETVAFLLKTAPEKSATRVIYDQAAHQLIARKITTFRNLPKLAPIVARLSDIQMMNMNRIDIEQQLLSKDDSEEAISINFIECFRKLSDHEALELLDIMRTDAIRYSYPEFSIVRYLTLELLSRDTIIFKLEDILDEEKIKSIGQLLIRRFPPICHIELGFSRSWSKDFKNALSHDEVFESCRHLLALILQSSMQTARSALFSLANWNSTTIWGLAHWLSDIRTIAEQSQITLGAFNATCFACLNAIITSENKKMTYSWKGKDYTIRWREKSEIPATVGNLILPLILEHYVDIISSIPKEIDEFNERSQVLCATVPVLSAKNVLAPLCANLINSFSGMSQWGERALCISFIREALKINNDFAIASHIEKVLKSTPLKWTEYSSLVSLLCGLPGARGNRFTELLYEEITPAKIVNNEKLWKMIDWIAEEIEAPGDLMTRLTEVIRIAQTEVDSASLRSRSLCVWATIISAFCSKIVGYRSNVSHEDAFYMIKFAAMPVFCRHAEQLVVESTKQDNSTGRVIGKGIDVWEQVSIKLINEVSDKTKLNSIGVECLLSLRESQLEFERVKNIIDTISQADLIHQNPALFMGCLEVCLKKQDLDGVETLFRQGFAITTKSCSEIGATFLTNALSSFWRLNEFSLSFSFLKNILMELQSSPHDISEEKLRNVLKLANEKLRLNFQNPPDLYMLFDSNHSHAGG